MTALLTPLLKLLRNKLYPPQDPTSSCAGQTILITGSSSGLGYEAARKFAQLGATRIILGVRDVGAGQRAATGIMEGVPSAASGEDEDGDYRCKVDVWHLDMCDFASVQAFGMRAREQFAAHRTELDNEENDEHGGGNGTAQEPGSSPFLHKVVLNAGVYKRNFVTIPSSLVRRQDLAEEQQQQQQEESTEEEDKNDAQEKDQEQWEETLKVNTLSTILLALLLLPCLEHTGKTYQRQLQHANSPTTNHHSSTTSRTGTLTLPVLEFVSSGLHQRADLLTSEQIHNEDLHLLHHFNNPGNFETGRQYAVSKLLLMYGMHGVIGVHRSRREREQQEEEEKGSKAQNSDHANHVHTDPTDPTPNPRREPGEPSNPQPASTHDSHEPLVLITSCCPGMVHTDLARDFSSPLYKAAKWLFAALFMRTPEQGARTLVSGTLGFSGAKGAMGGFWQHDELKKNPSPHDTSAPAQQLLPPSSSRTQPTKTVELTKSTTQTILATNRTNRFAAPENGMVRDTASSKQRQQRGFKTLQTLKSNDDDADDDVGAGILAELVH
ncbi:MAG: hypothetical protein M1831_003107 [Alyxoria varia]|nr:MAG: hypothetical protein M1831_003107 [Alyxoria varia]